MNRFNAWLLNFMRGRYGFDQLGRSLSVGVVVLWIASVLMGVLSNYLGLWAAWASTILNWAGLALLALMIFRMLSRNVDKRRAENMAYLERKQNKNRNKNSNKNRNRNRNRNSRAKDIFNSKAKGEEQEGYAYLACSFCGQQMRVPKGKGKIAVKCPSCGEKTIINS